MHKSEHTYTQTSIARGDRVYTWSHPFQAPVSARSAAPICNDLLGSEMVLMRARWVKSLKVHAAQALAGSPQLQQRVLVFRELVGIIYLNTKKKKKNG